MSDLPKRYLRFTEDYPEIAEAYKKLGDAVHNEGPLDEKSRAMIQLGISAGARYEGAVHSHVRKALDAGAKKEEIRQIALLSIPTTGFPNAMAVMSWIDDILDNV